jgi:hypothetical protein
MLTNILCFLAGLIIGPVLCHCVMLWALEPNPDELKDH